MLKFLFRKQRGPDVRAVLDEAAAHLAQGRVDEAEKVFQSILKDQPENYDAVHGLGQVRMRQDRRDEAAALLADAVRIKPDAPEALFNLGGALQALGRHAEALENYSTVVALEPEHVEALLHRGNLLHLSGRSAEAIADYDQALLFESELPVVSYNRGIVLLAIGRRSEAIASFQRTLSSNPRDPAALNNLAIALTEDAQLGEALAAYEQLVSIDPNYPHALGNVAYLRGQLAQWNERAALVQAVEAGVASEQPVVVPLVLLALSDDPAAQLNCARAHANARHPEWRRKDGNEARRPNERIRIAYVSADFHDHAMAYLMAGLFEQHDQRQFDIIAVSLGPDIPSAMRSRIRAGVERFVDVHGKSDVEIATMMREMQVDIAVDLMGYTGGARPDIFAHRSAPVQVNYLGFPGTMGAGYIDYILADRFVIPEGAQRHYAEKVVYLPDTFQANDDKRLIAEATPSRAEAGLPAHGFVFCSFNNTYKITPAMFDIWMRLLREVEGSVLWLLGGSATVVANLRKEADLRGVTSERLVFAAKLPYAEHLARYRLADLFLDTLPFNAGTTASDALWAGLPVLTCAGEAFAARMAGSLLHAAGLPELVTHTLSEYEARAAMLAKSPDALRDLRQRLASNRLTVPLFDTDRFRRHLELAYRKMWEIRQRGEAPRAFAVDEVAR